METCGRVAASTQNQALAALLLFYWDVLGHEIPWLDGLVRAKGPARLPVVMTRREVRTVVSHLERRAAPDGDPSLRLRSEAS